MYGKGRITPPYHSFQQETCEKHRKRLSAQTAKSVFLVVSRTDRVPSSLLTFITQWALPQKKVLISFARDHSIFLLIF